jgi:hypothetical protein
MVGIREGEEPYSMLKAIFNTQYSMFKGAGRARVMCR